MLQRTVPPCHCEGAEQGLAPAARGNLTTECRFIEMMYYVYMLTNKNKNVLYTGVTSDLVRRVYEHKHHLDQDSFTAKYNTTNLVYYECTSDVRAAIEREKQIKSWNRKRKNALIEAFNPEWNDLYGSILE